MSLNSRSQNRPRYLARHSVDFLIVILCLSAMAYSISLFRRDLSQTINLLNVKPVGNIVIKKNIVQRRFADHVLWDRLRVESPVYLGDIIRVAELSAATLDIEGQQIDLDEDTLIRILSAQDDSGALQIELSEGSLSVSTGADRGLQLAVHGKVIEMKADTALTVAAGKDGFSAQVNKGAAAFIEDGGNRTAAQGTSLSFNTEGEELRQPAAVVTQPGPNARYVKNTPQPLSVKFEWNRVNLEAKDRLRLEIATDRNFNRVVKSVGNLNSSAEISLDAGLWNWRLSYEGAILSTGRLTVIEASNLGLLSPVKGSLFRYHDDPPPVSFQWSEIEEALHYIIEISPTQDFTSPQISRQTVEASFTYPYLGPGTWYWRVQPVFPSAYEGVAGYSQFSWFNIEQAVLSAGDEIIILPEPNIKPAAVVKETPPVKAGKQRPPLPPPENRHPVNGYRIGIEELKTQKNIVFKWSSVAEANSYTITLYEQTSIGRRQIRRIPLGNNTTWTLDNVGLLGRGKFIWKVEASFVASDAAKRNGKVDRSGRPGENSFIIDIPIPEVHMENPGVLYGF